MAYDSVWNPAEAYDRLPSGQLIHGTRATTLAGRIYAQLRNALIFCRFAPNERLKVREMAALLQVSETPTREAMMQLAREGALELRARQSIRVRRPTLAEFISVRDIRLRLKPLSAELAMRNLINEDVRRLNDLHERYKLAESSGNVDHALQTAIEFHMAILWLSNEPALISILENLWIQVAPLFRLLQGDQLKINCCSGNHHERMMHAIRVRDTPALQAVMCEDLLEGSEPVIQLLREVEGRTRRYIPA